MKSKLTLLFLTLVVGSAQAQLAKTAGFGGELSLNAGYSSSESNFNTDNSRTINSLDISAEKDDTFIIAPLGSVTYTFGESLNQQVYLGTTRSDIAVGTLAFQLGYRYQLPSGVILDMAYLPTVLAGETWRDPYQLNAPRKTTDEGGNAYRFQLKRLFDGNVGLDFAYVDKDVEDEEITDSTLARDANIYQIKGDYRIQLSRTSMLQPSLIYINQDADGNAESFDSYGVDLSWFRFINRHRLVLTAGYTTRDYQSASNTFDRTRSDDSISLFAAYEYQNVFDWKNWSFVSLAGYSNTDSNIKFYDENAYLLSVGMSYQF